MLALLATLAATASAPAQAAPYGNGCATGAGLIPTLRLSAPPIGGTTVELRVAAGAPGAAGVLAVGMSASAWGAIPLPLRLRLPPNAAAGCELSVSPDLLVPLVADASGHAAVAVALPAWLTGAVAHAQAFVIDPGSQPALGASRALRIAVHAMPPDYALVLLPDTQHYSDSAVRIAHFEAQTRWIVDRLQPDRLAFAALVGDVVEHGAAGPSGNREEWERADRAMDTLDGDLTQNPDGWLPYVATVGNHDFDSVHVKTAATQFLAYFGPDRYAGRSWFFGSAPDRINFAQVFETGGGKLLGLGLEWRPSDAALAWAQDVLAAHPDLPAVVATHEHLLPGIPGRRSGHGGTLEGSGDNAGRDVYEKLVVPYPNVFLVLSGHHPGSGWLASTTPLGTAVLELLADFQLDPNGGNGWLQRLSMRPERGEIAVETRSPTYVAGVTAGPDRSVDPNANYTLPIDLLGHRHALHGLAVRRFRDGQRPGASAAVWWGTRDTHIGSGAAGVTRANLPAGSADTVRVDGAGDHEQGLLRFEGLFGTGPGQIPPGAQIERAILTLTTEGPNAASASGAAFHRMLVAWDEDSTWDSLGGGVQLGLEAHAQAEGSTEGRVGARGTASFDVTQSVRAWSSGAPNWGWVAMAAGVDLWEFRASEWSAVAERPMLTVVW